MLELKGRKMKKIALAIGLAGMLFLGGCGGGGGTSGGSTPQNYTYTLAQMNDDVENYGWYCPSGFTLPLEGHWPSNDILTGSSGKMFVSGLSRGSLQGHLVGFESVSVTNESGLRGVMDTDLVKFTASTKDLLYDHMENCKMNTAGLDSEYTTISRYYTQSITPPSGGSVH